LERARRRRADHYRACGALAALCAARSTRTLDNARGCRPVADETWNLERAEELRAAMSDADIEALRLREQKDPRSLTIDEVGVLYVVTRERIHDLERQATESDDDE
jgi:hypothetical protein